MSLTQATRITSLAAFKILLKLPLLHLKIRNKISMSCNEQILVRTGAFNMVYGAKTISSALTI